MGGRRLRLGRLEVVGRASGIRAAFIGGRRLVVRVRVLVRT